MVKTTTKKVKLSEIKLNPKNPRTITSKAMENLVKSLQDFPEMMELREIIVDENYEILGGNMRLRALQEIKAKDCMAKIVQGLTDKQKREFIIKDNAMFGEWDMDTLANSWSDLPLAEWGVDLPEAWLAGPDPEPKDAEPQIDQAEELNKVWKVKVGDLFQIDAHRLLCGDSTKREDVERVMGDANPLLMVTDPPYGVEYDANWRNEADRANGKPYGAGAIGRVTNDDRADWGPAWENFPGDVVYSWHPEGATSLVHGEALQDSGFEIRMVIIWAKNQFPIGRGHYHVKHEPCFYAVRKGRSAGWIGDHSQTTLWEIDKPRKSETGHSTQKPIECMARPIRNHESEFVYDPFLGSGTTMVACQNLNRKCRGIEISAPYVAVCLERMKTAFPEIEIKRVK